MITKCNRSSKLFCKLIKWNVTINLGCWWSPIFTCEFPIAYFPGKVYKKRIWKQFDWLTMTGVYIRKGNKLILQQQSTNTSSIYYKTAHNKLISNHLAKNLFKRKSVNNITTTTTSSTITTSTITPNTTKKIRQEHLYYTNY